MSTERFFDDLARTLAEPMPRRRAVRVIGVSLAAIAVPGFRPWTARAQSGACLPTTCGKDRLCCQKGAEANFETYCCPRPSWQFQCGNKGNGYRCVNTCKPGGTKYPCTGLFADREAGFNGLCCDSTYHALCVPHDPSNQTSSGGSRPSCKLCLGKMCGPKGAGPSHWNCCKPPAKCRNEVCRCPNGSESCDDKCCAKSEVCRQCLSGGTQVTSGPNVFDATIIGQKCCPRGSSCCGSTCCKELGCCGTKCCPVRTSRCATTRGRKLCCPKKQLQAKDGHWVCCPAGTLPAPWTSGGCCPPSSPHCCGSPSSPMSCGSGTICVSGKCVPQ